MGMTVKIVLGIDPGLAKTGWGIIRAQGNALSYVACGTIKTDAKTLSGDRLAQIYAALSDVLTEYQPTAAAVEEVFVNSNARTSLKLGQARGVCLLAPTLVGIQVAEYTPSQIKSAVVGTGRAAKDQIGFMVKTLLPTAKPDSEDAADALAVAITHAHMMQSAALRVA